MSDPQRWALIKGLFARAAELPPGDRAGFLDEQTGGDPELRARVEELLAADDASSDFLDEGVARAVKRLGVDEDGRHRWIGRRFGPYEVVDELGRGGMGVVLLARRADGRYDREVALKVVPAALVQGHLESRFRAEVRILADLDHPNIARLLDAGETDEGLAYLVMEYVDGPRIDRFADEGSLDVRARLTLFRQVLDGVDYAHARGVVHRDLKPSNILVTRSGVPKLVDFGIAKLLDPASSDAETQVLTRTAHRMLTPEYASPEQVRGEPVDARSDVYSLGIVLYRLLTGRAPYSLDDTAPQAAERVICERSPSRPSDAVTRTVPEDPARTRPADDPDVLARQRSSTRDRLQRSLRGDLDTIVLHALAKEPSRRYATAGAFSDDIDRHLEGRVIRARNPGPVYRAHRFVRRRWLPLAATIAGLLAATVLFVQTREAEAQRRVAEANSAELTGLVGSVLSTLNTDLSGRDQGPTATRVAAVEAAVASLDSLASRADGSPSPQLLEALAGAYQEVGTVQGHPTSASVGRVDDAVVSLERALDLWEELARLDPDRARPALEAVETRVLLADILRARGDHGQAGVLLDRAERDVDALAAVHGLDDVGTVSLVAMVAERQSWQRVAAGDFGAAETYVNRLTDLAWRTVELTPEGPGRVGVLEEVVLGLQAEAGLEGQLARHDEAIATQSDALALADSLAELPGSTQRVRGIRATAWYHLGWRYNDADRPARAEAAFDQALAYMSALEQEDPGNATIVASMGQFHEGRGQARIRGERWEEALVDLDRADELLTPILPSLPYVAFVLAQVHRERGEALARLARWSEAESAYERSVELARQLSAPDTTFAPARKVLALSHLSDALHHRLHAAAGDPAHCAYGEEAERIGQGHWSWLRGRNQLAPVEEAIWADFEGMMPEGACVGG